MLGIDLCFYRSQLVCLCEDDGEGDAAGAEPVDKLTVDLLLLVADVDEHEDIAELLTLENIGAYHLVELVLYGFGALGIAVAGKIDEIPFVVDDKIRRDTIRC